MSAQGGLGVVLAPFRPSLCSTEKVFSSDALSMYAYDDHA